MPDPSEMLIRSNQPLPEGYFCFNPSLSSANLRKPPKCFLQKNMHDRICKKIENLKYSISGLNDLLRILSNAGIDVEKLKGKLVSKGVISDA